MHRPASGLRVPLVTQIAGDRGFTGIVFRMLGAFEHRHAFEVERADAFQAGDIDADLARDRAAAVVGVDPAHRTEMVLGCHGVELVETQHLAATQQRQVFDKRADDDSAAHPAKRAIASARLVEAVEQFDREADRAAMARAIHGF